MVHIGKRSLCLIIALLLLSGVTVHASEYRQVHGLIDIRSTFSDGSYEIEDLTKMAKDRGFEVIFFHDHDRVAMEYGLAPIRNIIKKRVELPSVNLAGAEKYLAAIEQANSKFPEILALAGVEVAPFYYWTGDPLGDGLTSNDWERHFLVMGLGSAQDYETLPDIHNDYISASFGQERFGAIALFLAAAILGIIIARWHGAYKILGFTIVGCALLLAVDTSPLFFNPPYDQYHGPQGIAPYQALIDDVNKKGGVTFWNHMETSTGKRDMPPIKVSTLSYPEVLTESKGYTGFASIYGDNRTLTEPGKDWDQILLSYCGGLRSDPIWGISTADYHEEGKGTRALGHYQTVFLIRNELSSQSITNALKTGKFYASQGPYQTRPILHEFQVEDTETGDVALSGDELLLSGLPLIRLVVKAQDKTKHNITMRLIRGGELIKTFQGQTPFAMDYLDSDAIPGQKSYYRLDVKGDIGEIIANPIFVDPVR